MSEPTHYEVLAIPKSLIEDSNKDQIPKIIKQAYHRALLRHHPDKTNTPHKAGPATTTNTTSSPPPTVDQIARAYTTLSHPADRTAYDRHIALTRNPTAPSADGSRDTSATFQTGIETVDLDDLDYTEDAARATTRWHRGCRCGNEQGFAFGEDDLEEAGDLGELVVGCQDCSLWLRVCFAVVEDDVDDSSGGGGGGGVVGDGVGGKDEVTCEGSWGHAARSTGQLS
jgi:curved DNA-binding protein CbpA